MLPSEIESERRAMWRARQAGNEGRARVCARRAAGQALRRRYGAGREPGNAYTWLQWASSAGEVSDVVRRAAQRLAARVLPGGRPADDDDPLADAELILRLCTPAARPDSAE
jgi:hypothetical protein